MDATAAKRRLDSGESLMDVAASGLASAWSQGLRTSVDGQLNRFIVLLAHPVAAVAHAGSSDSGRLVTCPAGGVPATNWGTVGSADRSATAPRWHSTPSTARQSAI